MSEEKKYADAMRCGDLGRCIAIEKSHLLFGYPPEMVSVGLRAIDNGLDALDAISDYIASNQIDWRDSV